MDPTSVVLLFTLFQSMEKIIPFIGGKIADEMSKPIWEALEEKSKWLAGQDDTAKRWRAFSKAYAETKKGFLDSAPDHKLAQQFISFLESSQVIQTSRTLLTKTIVELEKASILTERPNTTVLSELFLIALETQSGGPPSPIQASDTVTHFIAVFQDKLFEQAAYSDLLLKKKEWEEKRRLRYDTQEHYLAQLIELHQDLEFVGIPELKDKNSVHIEDIFIQLRAESNLGFEIRRGVKPRVIISEALQQHRHMVILGDPGAGKTTLLKYIVVSYAKKQGGKLGVDETMIPVFIRLFDYVAKRTGRGNDYSIIDYLYTQARESLMLFLEPDFFEGALRKGNCCVCLDGLDELGSPGLRREITSIVTALVSRYPNNRYITTSRIVGYEEAPLDRKRFSHFTILTLSDEDIRQFIVKWYKVREKDQELANQRVKNLVDTIMGEPRIKALASNPLMLTIIALVHRIEAELPHERVKLYDKCVTTLIETWDSSKEISVQDRQRPHYRLRKRLLEQLAFHIHREPGRTGYVREIKEGDLELYLAVLLAENPKLQLDDEEARKEANEFVDLIKTRTGLLIERGEEIYSFAHLTFQEYLAAQDIEHRLAHSIDSIWNEIRSCLFDAHWSEVVLLLLGSLNKFEKHPTELVKKIFKSSDRYEAALHRYTFLAARILADRVEVDATLREGIYKSIIEIICYDPLAREDAISVIHWFWRDDGFTNKIREKLFDPNTQLEKQARIELARALGELGALDDAISFLKKIAYDEFDEHWSLGLRANAVEAIGKLSIVSDNISGTLFEIASSEMHHIARVFAAKTLGEIGYKEKALDILLTIARNVNLSVDERYKALESLGQLGLFDILSKLSKTSKRSDERNSADKQWEEKDVWLKDTSQQILQQYSSDVSSSLEQLLNLSKTKQTLSGKHHAILLSAKFGAIDQRALLLLELIFDKQVPLKIRDNAIQALGQFGNVVGKISDELRSIVQDTKADIETRTRVAEILGQQGNADDYMAVLLKILRDPSFPKPPKFIEGTSHSWTTKDVMEFLVRPDQIRIASFLSDVVSNSKLSGDLRCDSALALGKLGYPDQAVDTLLELLRVSGFEDLVKHKAYKGLKSFIGMPI